jgi:hypothetical protein
LISTRPRRASRRWLDSVPLPAAFDEAREWFEKARRVLEEQGARPRRAITDFHEALTEVRRGGAGDRQRALTLLDAARGPFESIGMPGWLRRAEEQLADRPSITR